MPQTTQPHNHPTSQMLNLIATQPHKCPTSQMPNLTTIQPHNNPTSQMPQTNQPHIRNQGRSAAAAWPRSTHCSIPIPSHTSTAIARLTTDGLQPGRGGRHVLHMSARHPHTPGTHVRPQSSRRATHVRLASPHCPAWLHDVWMYEMHGCRHAGS
eukprot:366568-Chlamydomonas_euryale.AAC.4